MTIAQEFDYFRPGTLDEAGKLLAEYGSRARVLAGGTDLVGMLMGEMVTPDVLVDIKDIGPLHHIDYKNNVLRVGALVPFNEVAEHQAVKEHFPLIAEMVGMVASYGLRNRATLVGNICSAVPCCDTGPVLLVYEAEVHVRGAGGERTIPIREWFVGPRKTACGTDEVATSVAVPLPDKKTGGCYVKLKRYQGEDLAQASVTVLALEGNQYRVAFGSVAPTPLRGERIEELLNGKELTDELVEQATKLVAESITPITDIRGSKEYRTFMTEVMLERGLKAAVARRDGAGPDYGQNLI